MLKRVTQHTGNASEKIPWLAGQNVGPHLHSGIPLLTQWAHCVLQPVSLNTSTITCSPIPRCHRETEISELLHRRLLSYSPNILNKHLLNGHPSPGHGRKDKYCLATPLIQKCSNWSGYYIVVLLWKVFCTDCYKILESAIVFKIISFPENDDWWMQTTHSVLTYKQYWQRTRVTVI